MYNIITILVGIFALVYVIQSIVTLFKSLESFDKKYYSGKLNQIKGRILDAEFSITQAKGVREGFRNEFDRIKEMQDACVVKMEEEKTKEDPDKTIIDNLTKLKKKYDPDIQKLSKQMETIDMQINGPYPNGEQCMQDTLEGLISVTEELKKLIKKS